MKFRVTERGSQTKSVAVEARHITRFIEVDAEDEDKAVDVATAVDRGKWTKIAEDDWYEIPEDRRNQDPEPSEEDWSDAEESVEVEPVE